MTGNKAAGSTDFARVANTLLPVYTVHRWGEWLWGIKPIAYPDKGLSHSKTLQTGTTER